jgi:hypothetical protein
MLRLLRRPAAPDAALLNVLLYTAVPPTPSHVFFSQVTCINAQPFACQMSWSTTGAQQSLQVLHHNMQQFAASDVPAVHFSKQPAMPAHLKACMLCNSRYAS